MPAALHKGDNQPHRDQGVQASDGDTEIKTGHEALLLEIDSFPGHCVSLARNWSTEVHHAVAGDSFREKKYKSVLLGLLKQNLVGTADGVPTTEPCRFPTLSGTSLSTSAPVPTHRAGAASCGLPKGMVA